MYSHIVCHKQERATCLSRRHKKTYQLIPDSQCLGPYHDVPTCIACIHVPHNMQSRECARDCQCSLLGPFSASHVPAMGRLASSKSLSLRLKSPKGQVSLVSKKQLQQMAQSSTSLETTVASKRLSPQTQAIGQRNNRTAEHDIEYYNLIHTFSDKPSTMTNPGRNPLWAVMRA